MPEPMSLAQIREARHRVASFVPRSPVVALQVEDAGARILLKLENLQPTGSFKVRGAGNAMALLDPERLANGVCTPSAGNMAQGVAWNARRLGVPCQVLVPDHAPRTKLEAVERLGGTITPLPYDQWWEVIVSGHHPGSRGELIHPASDPAVIAGNGTIGLEILEDVPDIDAVVIPFGGGGLCTGIASVMRALKPDVTVYACEVDTAAPLAASLAAGTPRTVHRTPSFVDGIGGKSVLEDMWPLLRALIDDVLVVSIPDVARAVKLLAERNRVVAEGAGATPVAAALAGRAGHGSVVCVVSGGNIDSTVMEEILAGHVP